MQIKTRIFKGLTFNILVEEAQATDTNGGRLWYLAAIYVQERGSQDRTLIRRTRLPGAAEELAAAIRRDGIRVFDGFRPTQTPAARAASRP
ncbi:hypothetical protein CO653_34145 [Rhizobium anhuiense]|uniref:hypothetical protein n=1 Tax=Rhizobium anhuiense TaxID=1184720 RepID=UPI000BE85A79|nr:hypothetical protein [Rhizobium anhuiense]PDS61265.1 hypothetical protein CO653_34145 [Rhizobium anhuiense]